MELILLLLFFSFLMPLITVSYYLIKGKELINGFMAVLIDFAALIIVPCLYLFEIDIDQARLNCDDNIADFYNLRAPVYAMIIFCLVAYFYTNYRYRIAPPIVEVVVNTLLVAGIMLNIKMLIDSTEPVLYLFGHVPIVLLFLKATIKSHRLFIEEAGEVDTSRMTRFQHILWTFLKLPLFQKYPFFVVLALPALIIASVVIILFGQKPDELINNLTDFYKNGMLYECKNPNYHGHYLCTVAAKGHQLLVRPLRMGVRNKQYIRCNRQLLVSNAFEELLEQHTPSLHRFVRHNYNKVGKVVRRYYGVFDNPWVSDVVYIVMKPFEWLFLLVLYIFDHNPESRIAQQYLSQDDRAKLRNRS